MSTNPNIVIFRIIITITAFLCLSSCSDDTTSYSAFELISEKHSNISFQNNLIDDPLIEQKNVLSFDHYFNGAGVATGDLNNDGLIDIIFTGNEAPNEIYINKGGFKFESITKTANINTNETWSTGVSLMDINGDGWLDIYICQSGHPSTLPNNRRNKLYVNNKNLTFTEAAELYGLDDPGLSHQAIFFDLDNDKDLDCMVFNTSKYVRIDLKAVYKDLENPKNVKNASSTLYLNNNGKFKDITEQAGVLAYGFALGCLVSDINKDGWLDMYQANDYSAPDFMYINQKDGTFKDEIKKYTKQGSWFSMGVDIADINNDLLLDIATVDMATSDHVRGKTLMEGMNRNNFNYFIYERGYQRQHMFNALQINQGNNKFSNLASLYGVLQSEWSWATLLTDFDNDGYKDFFITNGYRRYARDNDSRRRIRSARDPKTNSVPESKRKELYAQIPEFKLSNYMLKNNEGKQFENMSEEWGLDLPTYSNGAAYADFDNDGDLDLIINNIDSPASLYKNNLGNKNNYLNIELISNLPKVGANVVAIYKGQHQLLEYSPVRGYLSTVDDRLHLGLANTQTVDTLIVNWPSGRHQILTNVDANQFLKINLKDSKEGRYQYPQTTEEPIYTETTDIKYTHKENYYDDLITEVLLPYEQSKLGPGLATADVNGDGLDDVYIGGAPDQAGALWLQTKSSNFELSSQSIFNKHKDHEDHGAHFFDMDNDGDQDLYVVSGANEIENDDPLASDRLYINNGKGKFTDASDRLPSMTDIGLKVRSNDIDNDGDLDLIVGGRIIPKNYPKPPRSYILENNNGRFTDVTDSWSKEIATIGLVNDFIFTDFDNDDKDDLIIVGEWMPISFFKNTGSSYINVTDQKLDTPLSGWWFSIKELDLDNDGDQDLVVGNLGMNSKFHASSKKPFKVVSNDFDNNGVNDVVLIKEYKGKDVPVRGRECSSEQMPYIAEKFETYSGFANASVIDILGEDKINEGISLSVNTFENIILVNENGSYTVKNLPFEAQGFPIYGIESTDINNDGLIDLIVCGNIYNMEPETPRQDAGNGLTLINKGDMTFDAKGITSGFYAPYDAKGIIKVNKANGNECFIVANNNEKIQTFELQK